MMDDFNKAYAEAVEKETDIRDTSYTPEVPWNLDGVPLRWITPMDYKVLDDAGNLVLVRSWPVERIPIEHLAAFLWFLHANKDHAKRGFLTSLDKKIFIRIIAKRGVHFAKLARQYLEDNMQDSPADGGAASGVMPTSWMTILCDRIAAEYGWDDEAIIRKPIARLFQYLKLIHRRSHPELPTFNPSDSVKNRLMQT